MLDLNDLFFFSVVIKYRGFSAASRALQIPKSRLSKRVAGLEERLGVRLLERSSRSFQITEVGQALYERCEDVVASAVAAEALVAEARSEPRGVVRLSCPTGLVYRLERLLPGFLSAHPMVRLQLLLINRPVDLIAERIDIALRVRSRLDTEPLLMMRKLGVSNSVLVASPQFVLQRQGLTLDTLGSCPSLMLSEQGARPVWKLEHSDGRTADIALEPRLLCSDFDVLRLMVLDGLGVSLLPEEICAGDIERGAMVRVLPEWSGAVMTIHAIFTARHGLPPAVRALIDFLAQEFPASRGQPGSARIPGHLETPNFTCRSIAPMATALQTPLRSAG